MLYIATVLYNKEIKDIKSINEFNKLGKSGEARIIILDNSEEKYSKLNQKAAQVEKKYIYINNGGNIGLSKAYNKAFTYIKSIDQENFYILLSDDDTDFSEDYLKNVMNAIHQKERVISGIVNAGNSPFSPSDSMNLIFKHFITKPGNYNNIVCINSGLVLSRVIAENIFPINESMFLDMIDFWIFYRLKELDLCNVFIVDGEIKQSFSGEETRNENRRILKRRFNIYKRDCLEFAKSYKWKVIPVCILIMKRYASIMLKSKN